MRLLTPHMPQHADQSKHQTVLHTYQTSVPPLSFSSDQDHNTSDSSRDAAPEPSANEESSNEEEDFQTVPMDDEHWTTEMVPERPFCIHENGLPNNVCSYSCPYGTNGTTLYIDSLDLSNISDIEDHFLTTSDEEELPGLKEAPY